MVKPLRTLILSLVCICSGYQFGHLSHLYMFTERRNKVALNTTKSAQQDLMLVFLKILHKTPQEKIG